MPKIIQGKFKILANEKVGNGYFKMAVSAAGIARLAEPGQFVHLRCQDANQPLLRRPFSLHRFNQDYFEILYRVVGPGTQLLAKKQKGDRIDVLGPLGRGFKPEVIAAILVAGGMGVAPLLALAEKLIQTQGAANITVVLGAKTKAELLCATDFRNLGIKVHIATDDGSKGHKGLATALLAKLLLTTHNSQLTTIYACGPKAMLKEVAQLAQKFGISAQGSLEEIMACGLGACLGCAISTNSGYQRVCKEGPVFKLQEIKWSPVSCSCVAG